MSLLLSFFFSICCLSLFSEFFLSLFFDRFIMAPRPKRLSSPGASSSVPRTRRSRHSLFFAGLPDYVDSSQVISFRSLSIFFRLSSLFYARLYSWMFTITSCHLITTGLGHPPLISMVLFNPPGQTLISATQASKI